VDIDPDKTNMSHPRAIVARVRRRLAVEEGFTLIEMMIVLMTLGILMTVAIPTYLTFKDSAAKAAAKQKVSQAYRAVQSYKADNYPGSRNDPDGVSTDNGYTGMDLTGLAKYDSSLVTTSGIVPRPAGFTTDDTHFCITATVGRWTAIQSDASAAIQVGTTFTASGSTCSVT
jgi:prepilin-type N-terminal cleavage/methylation domain-containing protein